MDVVCIYNGLGNQMSQYAFYLSKKSRGQKVCYTCFNTGHNGFELERLFRIKGENKFFRGVYLLFWLKGQNTYGRIITNILNRFGVHFYNEDCNYSYNHKAASPNHGVTFFLGGWHNPLYFDDYSEQIKKIFVFPAIDDEENRGIIKSANDDNTVAIHIRGGDYLQGNLYESYGVVCNQDYYEKAMQLIEKRIEKPRYFVFTNDVALTKRYLKDRNYTIVNNNSGSNSWKDMAIMSKFKNIIIANSTFSWWAAYLGCEKKLVICPKYLQAGNLTSNIFAKTWTKVDY